jgi:hypothetical protein
VQPLVVLLEATGGEAGGGAGGSRWPAVLFSFSLYPLCFLFSSLLLFFLLSASPLFSLISLLSLLLSLVLFFFSFFPSPPFCLFFASVFIRREGR